MLIPGVLLELGWRVHRATAIFCSGIRRTRISPLSPIARISNGRSSGYRIIVRFPGNSKWMSASWSPQQRAGYPELAAASARLCE